MNAGEFLTLKDRLEKAELVIAHQARIFAEKQAALTRELNQSKGRLEAVIQMHVAQLEEIIPRIKGIKLQTQLERSLKQLLAQLERQA